MSIVVIAPPLLASLLLLIVLRSHLHKKHPLARPLLTSSGTVDAPLTPKGSVIIDGELWLARSSNGSTIPAKTKIKVIGFEDHVLLVAQR